MGKLVVNEFLPDFVYETPFEKDLLISDVVKKQKKTIILFLRYYGCTLCQYDMNELAAHYEKITGKGAQALVVLQSDVESLKAQLQTKEAFPFDIICDPEQKLYHKFEIQPAESMVKMMGGKGVMKAVRATAKGYKHGAYEGEELQLPAVFIVDNEMKISFVHYGVHVADIPSAEGLVKLL